MCKLRRELSRGSESLELGQLPLHFKQPQVCLFELLLAVGNLRSGFVHAVLEPPLLDVELLGHLAYSAEHSIESRSEKTDLIGRGRLDFGGKVSLFRP